MIKTKRIDEKTIQIYSDEKLYALGSAVSVVCAEAPIKTAQVHFYSEKEWEKLQKDMQKIQHIIDKSKNFEPLDADTETTKEAQPQ